MTGDKKKSAPRFVAWLRSRVYWWQKGTAPIRGLSGASAFRGLWERMARPLAIVTMRAVAVRPITKKGKTEERSNAAYQDVAVVDMTGMAAAYAYLELAGNSSVGLTGRWVPQFDGENYEEVGTAHTEFAVGVGAGRVIAWGHGDPQATATGNMGPVDALVFQLKVTNAGTATYKLAISISDHHSGG